MAPNGVDIGVKFAVLAEKIVFLAVIFENLSAVGKKLALATGGAYVKT